jgi:hypothetical protein
MRTLHKLMKSGRINKVWSLFLQKPLEKSVKRHI